MGYRSLNLSRVGRAILIGISLLLLMSRNAWSQEAIAPLIQPYIEQLTDDNPSNDKEAIQKARERNDIDGVIDGLIIFILNRGQLKSRRQAAIKVLGEIGPSAKKAVQPLIKVLQDPQKTQKDKKSRWLAAESLGKIGSEAKAAVKPLIQELKTNPCQPIVFHSIHALMKISPTEPETVEALIYTLENYNDDQVRSRASSAIGFAIEKIESLERLNQTLVKLKELTKETNSWQVRLGAAQSLATSGRDVKLAVETLINLLQETDEEILKKSLESLTISLVNGLPKRAPNLTSQERKNAISGLETILIFFQDNQDNKDIFPTIYLEKIKELEVPLNNTLKILKEIRKLDLIIEIIFRLIATYPKISILLLALFLWFLSISFLLLIDPIRLLQIHDFLESNQIGELEFGEKIKISLLRKLLFNIHYHPRVLDQWVKLKIDKVNENFQEKTIVKDRKIHIPIPVVIDNEYISKLMAKDLQKKFVGQIQWLYIYGEGGSGKTSLACQIAHWAMSDISAERLCKYQMLPILLEEEEVLELVKKEKLNLEAEIKKKERSRDDDSIIKKVFLRVICALLRKLVDEENSLSEELVEQLLRKRRLLVIIDGFSEMDLIIKDYITPQLADSPVNALVVTSRRRDKSGNMTTIELKPLKRVLDELLNFMELYLDNLAKRNLFDDQELSKHCRQLSEMADNDITVMLAKLYADQMIAVKTNKISDNVPKNIPEVILYYLNGLNKNNKQENALGYNDTIVRDDAKVVAWECIKEQYQPGRAIIKDVLAQLGGDKPQERLKYLEDSLGIIKTITPGENEICYCLNLLAEYLAGLYLVETLYQDNEISWRDFLRKVDTLGQPNLSIGFLKALHKCCLASRDQVQIPEFLLNKLISIINDSDLDYS